MPVQRVLALVGTKIQEYVAAVASLGAASAGQIVALNAFGQVDVSMMPTGIGPEVQILTASEAISAGAFVNIYSSGGSFAMRNADGTQAGKEADGFVLAAVTSGSQGTAYLAGINTAVTGQVPGLVYLSDAALGQASTAPATTATHVYQPIGVALSATSIQFVPGQAITRS